MNGKKRTTALLLFATIHIWTWILMRNCSGETFNWSERSLQQQADNLKCCPTNYYKATVPKMRKNTTNSSNLIIMGKVADIEVCALLCCEIEDCSMAWMENQVCKSVHCINECQIEKAPSTHSQSAVVEMRRNCQSTLASRSHGQKDVTGEKYDENKSTIVTKQAVTSSNNVVQKSSIPEQQQQQQSDMSKDNKQESLVTISNQSPMEQLLQKESTMIHTKAAADRVKGSGDEQASGVKKTQGISSNIQTLSEHLKKVDEKADITALEENDAKKDHPKHKYHRRHDLRHSLISPIIIGAFTCMAVIAVSGFAMAIIKYQKERQERTKSTQTLESN